MALNKKVEEAINNQINAEFHSAYLYLSMNSYCQSIGLSGVANWMRIQAQEELTHGAKFFDFVIERGGRVLLKPIEGVATEWNGPLAVFEAVMVHEQKITSMINNLYDVALETRDHATASMLKWFIDEQVEEEANVQKIIDNLKLIGSQGNGLFMIDRELSTRVFVDATQSAK